MGAPEAGLLAVVLAGGLGTRIRELHPDVPKPMIPVAGKPFLFWVLRYLRRQGISRAVVSIGHLAPVVERWLATRPVEGLDARGVVEDRPLGTAGGFLHAVKAAGPADAVVVVNGDSIVVADLAPALAAVRAGADGALLGIEVEDASRYGTLELDGPGSLVAFREKRPGPAVVNAGVYVFPSRTIEAFPSRTPLSFEADVFPELLARGRRLTVVRTTAPFIDIGIPESLARADAFARAHLE